MLVGRTGKVKMKKTIRRLLMLDIFYTFPRIIVI